MYKLNCFVLGDDPRHIFEIEIALTESVSALRKANVIFWKVDLPVDETIEHNLSSLTLDTKESLSPDEHLHIVIQGPPAVPSGPLRLKLKLNCIVLGDDPSHAFEIKIAPTESVSALQKAIKDAKKPHFDHVAADNLKLWKVKINLNDPHLLNAIGDEGVELKPLTELSKVFTDGVERGCIHVVVRHPAVARGRSMEDPNDHMAELNKASGGGCPDQAFIPRAAKFPEDAGTGDAERQQAKLCPLTRDLANVRHAADKAAEAHRRASQHNTSLSDNSLAEYRSLKASASVLAVSERQALETLS
ncbi:hypothetical protein DFJ58DRAFT_729029 [Suillus subalutaceus]|uniref:uncharacterized protein n=1 Tax=Suillus subalutaceus TaxID=48586 RepID=UPI001B860ABE|nr:uncharacterized protein DFJ58DRAFT_729029 [Suillus subalutaceus]KAG1851048.1 hypothetical protein DFJ58DRAFT_729029 [Suillus subalutaceus]